MAGDEALVMTSLVITFTFFCKGEGVLFSE